MGVLHDLVLSGETIKDVIKLDLEVDDMNDDGQTALHIAAALSRFDSAVLLITAGASPVILNKDNQRPVDLAVLPALKSYLINALKNQPYRYLSVF